MAEYVDALTRGIESERAEELALAHAQAPGAARTAEAPQATDRPPMGQAMLHCVALLVRMQPMRASVGVLRPAEPAAYAPRICLRRPVGETQ